jgi:hypothetical protein
MTPILSATATLLSFAIASLTFCSSLFVTISLAVLSLIALSYLQPKPGSPTLGVTSHKAHLGLLQDTTARPLFVAATSLQSLPDSWAAIPIRAVVRALLTAAYSRHFRTAFSIPFTPASMFTVRAMRAQPSCAEPRGLAQGAGSPSHSVQRGAAIARTRSPALADRECNVCTTGLELPQPGVEFRELPAGGAGHLDNFVFRAPPFATGSS